MNTSPSLPPSPLPLSFFLWSTEKENRENESIIYQNERKTTKEIKMARTSSSTATETIDGGACMTPSTGSKDIKKKKGESSTKVFDILWREALSYIRVSFIKVIERTLFYFYKILLLFFFSLSLPSLLPDIIDFMHPTANLNANSTDRNEFNALNHEP